MLLEDHRRRQRGFEAVRRAGADHAAKAAQRLAADFSLLYGQRVQPCLDRERRTQARDETTLLRRQRERRRLDPVSAWERARR